MEEILVTAQKRTEALINVPASVTVVGGDKLESNNVRDLQDLAAYVPGLTMRDAGGVGFRSLTLRGLTTNASGRIMGIYVDDVPFGSGTAYTGNAGFSLDLGLSDLQQVEVLRGPQGTLYGASAMGGILKYVTKGPNLTKFEAKVDASVGVVDGDDTDRMARVMINAPLVDQKVGLRVTAYHQHFGGYVDDVSRHLKNIDDADLYGGRAQILLAPSDNLKIKLQAFSQDTRRTNLSQVQWNVVTRAPLNPGGDFATSQTADQPFTFRFREYSGSLDYDFGFASLTAIVSRETNKVDSTQDGTKTYQALLKAALGVDLAQYLLPFHQGLGKNTAEVRLTSPTGDRFEWLVGVYYSKEVNFNFQQLLGYNAAGVPSPINFATIALPSKYRESAGFANATFHITDKWDISGGVRGARDDQTYTQAASGLLIGAFPQSSSREELTTWQASSKYNVYDRTNVYARVATGYRPGGPNSVALDPATKQPLAPPTFGADKTTNYEIGIKSEPTKWLSFDLTGYWIEWKTIQLAAARNGFSVLANGGDAKSRGIEFQAAARPFDGLTLGATFAYTNATLTDPAPDLSGVPGDRLPTIPRWAWSGTADYEWAAFAGWNATVGGTLQYVGERNSGFAGSKTSPNYRMDSYTTVDLRAGLSDGRYQLNAFVQNLTDERGLANAGVSVSGGVTNANVVFVRPRTTGLRFSVQF
ncbi:TonB-dependent receptor [Rhodospirillales bacterium TMPK1]|uniref:TonB-dependent receptor n=2 Tax=Roseiterribacter gracilis TaxID=2812848 RepID=A0A8S8XCK2_9PROT|nr:TonB-dependent receptor [Rhodospirillales bacterium TMPK1]